MKKIIFMISLFGLFILASCGNKTNSDKSQNINKIESNQNVDDNQNEDEDSNEDSNDSELPDYNDGKTWDGPIF